MSNEEIKEKVTEILPDNVICYNVENINHRPHLFMITNKHISNSKGMHLDVNSAPCGFKNCTLKYSEHTSDKVIFLQLRDNINKDVIQKILQKIVEALPEKSFNGFSFIETEEKYRIL